MRESFEYEVDPETVCQYIGESDKAGNKIWENDICKMIYDGSENIYLVAWDESELDFKGTDGKEKYGRNFQYLMSCEEIVKIGNVFDNPELMNNNCKESVGNE